MKKSLKTLLSLLLTVVIAFSACFPAFAIENLSNSATTYMVGVETMNVQTSAVKKAIKWALKHSDDLVKSASKWIGKDAAKVVEKSFSKATPVLKKLLKYDTLVWDTVQDQLTHVVGRQAAIWIRMALEWLI